MNEATGIVPNVGVKNYVLMKTVITLQCGTTIETPCKVVVPITTKVKISSKYATNARIEKERVEGAIFNRIDRQVERAVNQRNERRAKRQ